MTSRTITRLFLSTILAGCGNGKHTAGDTGTDVIPDTPPDGDAPDIVGDGPCTTSAECSNGLHCDGEEECVDGECQPGDPVDCDDSDDCTVDTCDETADECDSTPASGVVPVVSQARITETTGDSEIPALAWTGSEYGVAWLDGVLGATTVRFARLSASGTPVGSDVQVSSGTDHFPITQIDTVWTGSEFGVVWLAVYLDSTMGSILARVAADGTALGSEVPVTAESPTEMGPALAWTGSEYGVAWSDYRVSSDNAEVYFARFSGDLAKIGSDVLVSITGDHETLADIEWSGSLYGLLYHEYLVGGPDIHFTRLAPDGSMVGPDLAVTTSDTASSITRSLVWTGSEYASAWMWSESGSTDGAWDIYLGRISESGAKVGSDVQVSTGPATYGFPALAWTGSLFALGWTETSGASTEIRLGVVSSAGTPIGEPYAVTADDALVSDFPDVAASDEIAVAWKDKRDGASEIYLSTFGLCE